VHIEVETRNVDGQVTSLGTAEPFTLVVDRPTEGGGGGLGFNGAQLLYLAVAGCISKVDDIAEIPNSLRQGTHVRLVGAKVGHTP
jgi:uncharacterized OsmC-like protein